MHLIQFATDTYNQHFGRTELKRTLKRIYGRDGHSLDELVEYDYNPDTYLLRKVMTRNEKGEQLEKFVYNMSDYTDTRGALNLLRANKMYNVPISNETWLIKSPTDKQLVSMEAFDYQQIGNGDIRAVKSYVLQTNTPLTVSEIGVFNPASVIRNSQYIKEVTTQTFNEKGGTADIISQGRISGAIYDDVGKSLIARIEHASSTQVAFSSFEIGQSGNWILSGTPAYVSDPTTPTGERCLNMNGVTSIRKSGLNSAQQYLISYWCKNGSLSSNGTVHSSLTGRTENGWVIKYLTISGTTEIVLTGTGLIDELRLHPINSNLQTCTWDISGNAISETTGQNITIKKEYDGLNRLRFIRDQQNNILEAYQYSPKSL